MHRHVCPKCGRWWEHGDECIDNRKAHTCECGTQVWYMAFRVRVEGEKIDRSCASPLLTRVKDFILGR